MKTPKYPGGGLSFVTCAIARIDPKVEGDAPRYEIKLSDETVMDRGFAEFKWRERIVHSANAVRLGRLEAGRAAFLYEHDTKDQIGVLHSPRLEGGALYAQVRWASHARAAEVRQMVDDDVRTNISAGMNHYAVKLVERNEASGDLWDVVDWEPMEASSVAIGNNPNAAFVQHNQGEAPRPVEVVEEPVTQEARKMKHVRTDSGGVLEVADNDPREAMSSEQIQHYKSAEIVRMCEAHGMSGLTAHYIQSGLSTGQVAEDILKRKGTVGKPMVPARDDDPLKALGKRERNSYSYARAILGAYDGKLDGLEAEVDQELRGATQDLKKYRKADYGQGLLVPWSLLTEEERLQRYTMSTQVATKGVEAVFERQGDVIELLRNALATVRLGARMLTGLSSPIAFPKQTGAITAYWVGENPVAAVTASDPALGLVTLTPRTLQATTSTSRQLLAQASIDVEGWLRNDLAQVHRIALDRAAIHGMGTGGEPRGVYTVPDATSQAMGGAVDYTELTTMIGKVADKNALAGSPGWLTTPLMAAKWLATLDFAAAATGRAIWQGRIDTDGPGGTIAGYPAFSSNQVSSTMTGTAGATTGGSDHGIVFGNWGDMIIGLFGAMEIIVDPYAQKKSGLIELTSFQMADVIVRHGESFCKATGATTA